jgi:tRNA dimethylallyltransferase
MRKPKVIFLLGPTAAGKSKLALKLAKKLNAEIVSCDSMQIYKGMKVISSQPSTEQCRKVRHHLINMLSPQKEYNAALYRRQVEAAIKKIIKRKKIPLFVGGTGFYASALIDGVFKGPGADEGIRRKLYWQAEAKGVEYLYKRLLKVDRQAAKKIHPHDLRRIVRALEVWIKSRKPISEWQDERRGIDKDYNVKVFCLDLPRQELYSRINQRVEQMFKKGLVDEVGKLLKLKLSKTASCAIGIKEVRDYLNGKCGLEEAKELLKRHTRQYAKRQLTWFRKDKRIVWVKKNNLLRVISAASGG